MSSLNLSPGPRLKATSGASLKTTLAWPLGGGGSTRQPTGRAATRRAPILARAAFGVSHGHNNRLNYSARAHELALTAPRTETLALLHQASTPERPVRKFVDHWAVVDGFSALIDGAPPGAKGEMAAAWARVHRALQAKPDFFRIGKKPATWVHRASTGA